MEIERDGVELQVVVSGVVLHDSHLGSFEEPPGGSWVEDLIARTSDGVEVPLSDLEATFAEDLLLEDAC
jgi:hypothetical protein